MKLRLHTDGGSRGNPGPAGYGYVVSDNSSGAAIILRKCGNYCGETTNNQAEYYGLINGLVWISKNCQAVDDLEIVMDSLLIVNQVKGLYKVKHPELAKRHQEVKSLLQNFSKWSISHTYRSGNSSADELVNRAIDIRGQVLS
ncbi:MAG: ribonuclease HI family protein [bacterium]